MTYNNRFPVKKMILTGMFTAIISVMSLIEIPIQPIPFSLSLLAIFLSGALLEPKYALLSTLAYILLGAFGLPVFAGFKGGFHVLTGMTGGFIMSYPIMAFITALSYQVSRRIKVKTIAKNIYLFAIPSFAMLFSLFICYLFGTYWFVHISGSTITYALTVCVFPFIGFDLIKIAITLGFSTVLRRAIRQVS
jgi:biotin transport system substrate-specific component